MYESDQKRILTERILKYVTNPNTSEINNLLQKSAPELEVLLEKMLTIAEKHDSNETVEAYRDEMRRESALDAAYTNAIRNVTLNGKYLTDSEANKNMFVSLLNPGEDPSPAIYRTLALQFSSRFSWHTPQPRKTDTDRQVEFARICREHSLSECAANQQLHKEGVSLDAWAGASGLELAAFLAEAAQARQKFLINQASPTQLKQEAAWESQQNRAAAVQAEADRQHQISSQQQQQSGMFPPLPAVHAETGENIDASWLRKTSTINFELFKRLCRRHGSAAINERLRISATPAV